MRYNYSRRPHFFALPSPPTNAGKASTCRTERIEDLSKGKGGTIIAVLADEGMEPGGSSETDSSDKTNHGLLYYSCPVYVIWGNMFNEIN
jgi:hypothetical protein